MTPRKLKECFEEHFEVEVTKDGMKKIYRYFSKYEEEIIEESLECCFEQYEDAEEAFSKLGGICHNKSVQYIEQL